MPYSTPHCPVMTPGSFRGPAFTDMGLDPAPEVICQRVILADSKIVGQAAAELDPGSKAAHEVERLYGWVRDTDSGRWSRAEDSWVVGKRVGWCAMGRGG